MSFHERWGGHISEDSVGRVGLLVNKVLRKAKRYEFADNLLTFPAVLKQSDEQLFLYVLSVPITVFISFA